MGRDKNECIAWLKGKKIRKRFAKNIWRTSMKEWPEEVIS
jgi:hypothetical protein